ncbi:MAG: WXG100 family type VII secretion target [Chloroflexota bacterium]|nr:WXG100 family type VII secretion target [Chloroflexota bacterium]
MSEDIIKLEYDAAEDMARTFDQGANRLQTVLQEVQKIAKTLEDGALLGRGGESFVEAINGNFTTSLTKLIEKYEELKGDVEAAINYMKEADAKSQGLF